MNRYERKLHAMKIDAPFQIGDRFLLCFDGGFFVTYEVTGMRLHSMRQVGGVSGRTYTVKTGEVGEMKMNEARLEFLVHKYSVAVLALGRNKPCAERDEDYEYIVDEDADINPENSDNAGGAV